MTKTEYAVLILAAVLLMTVMWESFNKRDQKRLRRERLDEVTKSICAELSLNADHAERAGQECAARAIRWAKDVVEMDLLMLREDVDDGKIYVE